MVAEWQKHKLLSRPFDCAAIKCHYMPFRAESPHAIKCYLPHKKTTLQATFNLISDADKM